MAGATQVLSSSYDGLPFANEEVHFLRCSLDSRIQQLALSSDCNPLTRSDGSYFANCDLQESPSTSAYSTPIEFFDDYEEPMALLQWKVEALAKGLEYDVRHENEAVWKQQIAQWSSKIRELSPCLSKYLVIRKGKKADDRPYSDIQGPEFSHPKNPRTAGSYVKLGNLVAIMHQMPVERTMNDIIQSIYNHRTPVVVCLASTKDDKNTACQPCWEKLPCKNQSQKSSETGQILYERLFQYDGHDIIHLHLDGWNDENVDPDFDLLFEAIQKFHEIVVNKEGVPLIHCSGGINRSRLFLILYHVYTIWLKDPTAEINIPLLLMTTLIHRPCMRKNVLEWLAQALPKLNQSMTRHDEY